MRAGEQVSAYAAWLTMYRAGGRIGKRQQGRTLARAKLAEEHRWRRDLRHAHSAAVHPETVSALLGSYLPIGTMRLALKNHFIGINFFTLPCFSRHSIRRNSPRMRLASGSLIFSRRNSCSRSRWLTARIDAGE